MELFHSRRAPTYAPHGIVASSQPLTAQVGLQVLKEGGNAVDAAIAMAATANVTEPMMNGLGGDAFVMIFWKGKLQPQGQVQILLNLIDRRMNLQEAVDAPRVRALGGLRISVEQTYADELVARLASMGHDIVSGEETPADWIQPDEFARSFKGSAQAVAIDRNLGHPLRSVRSSTGWNRHRILGWRGMAR